MSDARTIAIVDDNRVSRQSTLCFLQSVGYHGLGFVNGETFLATELAPMPDCALLDLDMPGTNGLDVLRRLKAERAAVPILVVAGHGEVADAVQAIKLGADNVLEKPCSSRDLLEAIDSVLADHAAPELSVDAQAAAKVASLSHRQLEILTGVVRGTPNKLIAYQLGLSIRTVEAYRAQMLAKLGVRSSAEAIRIAVAAGLRID